MSLQSTKENNLKSFADRSVAIDYLRSFTTILVLLLHAILAYPTWGKFNQENYVRNSTAPIIDPMKWKGFDFPPTLLNLYFMALMFFISGLFVWNSLKKKGVLLFLKDRFLRLGIPFVISLVVIMPIAYYPSFLMTGEKQDFYSYWMGWSWNSGPAWFILLLIIYNMITALIFLIPKSGIFNIKFSTMVFTKPLVFFGLLLIFSTIAFLPMLYFYGPFEWLIFGPLIVGQTSKILHYLVYFLAGVLVGSIGIKNCFLSENGSFCNYWLGWVILCFFSTLLFLLSFNFMHMNLGEDWYPPKKGWFFLGISMEIYCAVFLMAFFAIFLRFFNAKNVVFDNLNGNAYGIYLVHYPFVIWSQYLLVDFHMPAILKALMVFVFSLGFSWGTSTLLRSVPMVRKIL